MGQSVYRVEKLVTLASAGVVEIPHPTAALLHRIIISRSAAGAFNASLLTQRLDSAALKIYRVVAGSNTRARLYIESPHPFKPQDFVTISSVSVAYNQTSVPVLQTGENWIDVDIEYGVSVNPPTGQVIRAVPTWARDNLTLIGDTAAESSVATLLDGTESSPLPYYCSERASNLPVSRIFFNISSAGTYLVTVLGLELSHT